MILLNLSTAAFRSVSASISRCVGGRISIWSVLKPALMALAWRFQKLDALPCLSLSLIWVICVIVRSSSDVSNGIGVSYCSPPINLFITSCNKKALSASNWNCCCLSAVSLYSCCNCSSMRRACSCCCSRGEGGCAVVAVGSVVVLMGDAGGELKVSSSTLTITGGGLAIRCCRCLGGGGGGLFLGIFLLCSICMALSSVDPIIDA